MPLSWCFLGTVGIVIISVAVGCVSDMPTESFVSLTPVASSGAPLSSSPDIALVDDNTACVIDSHEIQIHCVDRRGSVVGIFGREGEGPGEYRNPAYVERGPDGTLGVFDLKLARMTALGPTGVVLSETKLPPVFFPTGPFVKTVKGHYLTVPEATRIRTELEVGSGAVLWERSGPNDLAETECGILGPGLPGPDGGYVFRACESELVFLPDRDAALATVVSAPTYVPELPNERDVDAYREDLAAMAGGMSMPASAMDPYLDGFREEPKKWFLVPHSLAYDEKGRLWVATTRGRDAFSYLDLYAGVDYAGTVRIRDRLMGYDLLGSTMAALVERPPGPDGIGRRAIDWYRIDGFELGLR